MSGFEERKIGDTVFLVFADGMVAADRVRELRIRGDGTAAVCVKDGGWLVLSLKGSQVA